MFQYPKCALEAPDTAESMPKTSSLILLGRNPSTSKRKVENGGSDADLDTTGYSYNNFTSNPVFIARAWPTSQFTPTQMMADIIMVDM